MPADSENIPDTSQVFGPKLVNDYTRKKLHDRVIWGLTINFNSNMSMSQQTQHSQKKMHGGCLHEGPSQIIKLGDGRLAWDNTVYVISCIIYTPCLQCQAVFGDFRPDAYKPGELASVVLPQR